MSVKVVDNTPTILINHSRGVNLAIRFMLDAIDQEAFPKTPKRKGELRKDLLKHVAASKGTIKWHEKYAAVQEAGMIKGRPIRKYTTSGTGSRFAYNAVDKVARNSMTYFKKANVI